MSLSTTLQQELLSRTTILNSSNCTDLQQVGTHEEGLHTCQYQSFIVFDQHSDVKGDENSRNLVVAGT